MSIYLIPGIAAIVLAAVLSGLYFRRKTGDKISYMLDALEDGETNFKFSEERIWDRRLNRTLNRLRRIFEKEKEQIREQEAFYGKMLENVQTGIIVSDKENGQIIYCNSRALSLLGLSALMNIRQLSRISQELAETFSAISNGQEARSSYCNESSKMTISVTASEAIIGGRPVKIIAFNDISREIEENESESWTRLIRVMTHEIMNTITPIASLSETLSGYISTGADRNADDMGTGSGIPADTRIKEGLDTIASSAKGLVRFVNSYRNLTHIPAPSKNAFYLKDMVSKVFSLTEDLMASAGVQCSYKELSEDIVIYADDNQIAQIAINLLKNAVQAGADRISISARIDSMGCVIIDIANNGQPVSKESQEDIFTPFFTTKPDGTGIGLSISRQIMRLHNGTLRLTKSDDASTVFTMVFK